MVFLHSHGVALNCRPWVRSVCQVPLAVTHSPAEIDTTWPMTVTKSLWPRVVVEGHPFHKAGKNLAWFTDLRHDDAKNLLQADNPAGCHIMTGTGNYEIPARRQTGRDPRQPKKSAGKAAKFLVESIWPPCS